MAFQICCKKFLLHCETENLNFIGISIENMLEELPNLRYWCRAEHVTPAGRNITYVFLCFYFYTDFKVLVEKIHPFIFHTDVYKDAKPSRLIRDYVKAKGFSWNLGKSKPIPGTFIEKKGGL